VIVPSLLALLAMLAPAGASADQAPADVLRICADPDNLPNSRADGSGFENQIARLLAQELGVQLQYAWLPDRRGFVRKTMGAGQCDVLVGVPVGFERASLTAPYYRSSYVWLQRADAGAPPSGFDDPRLAQLRVGVQLIGNDMAMSPPAVALARHAPAARVVGFPIAGDRPSAERIVAALAAGDIDAALVWGPQAGFFAKQSPVPLAIARIAPPADQPPAQRFDFAIAVGVRPGDDALRDRLQAALHRRQPDIDRILAQYGVPLLGVTP
jgi:mxaJ protein